MAQLFAIGGGIIGSIFFGPVGGMIGSMIGGLIGGLLFPPPVGGAKLSDLKVTASTYGTPIPWGWGVVRVGGNVIWCSELIQHNEGNGKGSLGGPSVYQYTWTGALALCGTDATGPISDVLRIWADTKIVFDKTGETLGTHSQYGQPISSKGGSSGGPGQGPTGSWFNNVGTFRIYYGTEDQLPDPAMESLFGSANCNANRGQAYVVFDNINLINYGNRVPSFTFEVAFAGSAGAAQLSAPIVWDAGDTIVGDVGSGFCCVDAGRQQAYFFSNSSGHQGIKVVDLTTRDEIQWCETDIFGLDPVALVGADGLLYVTSGTSDLNPLYQINPDAITPTNNGVVGQYGTGGSFIGGSGIPACSAFATAAVNGVVYLAVFASGTLTPKSCMIFQGLNPIGNSSGEFSDGLIQACSAFNLSNTNAVAYAIGTPNYGGGGSSDPVNFYSINASVGLATPMNPSGSFYAPGVFFAPIFSVSPNQIDPGWTEFDGVVGPILDQTDGNLIVFFQSPNSGGGILSQYYITKINSGSGEVMWTTFTATPSQDVGTMLSIPFTEITYQAQIVNGTMGWMDTTGATGGSAGEHTVFLVETQGGAINYQTWPDLELQGAQVWADSVGSILFYGFIEDVVIHQWGVLVADIAEAQAIPVATIVEEICENVGFVASDLDTMPISTLECEGFILDQQTTAKDGIAPLALAFTFDGVESDGLIKFIPRGGAPIATVSSNDLVYMDKKLNSLVNETRTQEVDLPNQISINFIDPTRDFESSTQYFRRPSNPYPTMFSKNPRTENLALVAQPTFIKQLCEKLLFMQWTERVSYKTKLPWKYLQYDPTDVLTLTLTDSSTVQTRTVGIQVGADMSMEMQSVAESSEVFSPNSTAAGGLFPQYLIQPSTATKMFLLDTPLLRDIDDTGETSTFLYYALSGYSSNWAGANILLSPNNTNFQIVGQPITQEANWGVATNALGAPVRPFSTDYINSVNVVMNNGGTNLSSCTYLEMMNGANGGVLYNTTTGAVEIIQFMTVVQNADGSFTLSGLLRGRRGTDTMTGGHVAGEYFIYLGSSITAATGFGKIGQTLANYNAQEFYEAVGIGQLQEGAISVAFSDTMRTLQPYAPGHVQATTSGSDIDLTWLRRTRINGNLRDYSGTVPLNESYEAYAIDIYNGANIVRTLTVNYGNDSASPQDPPGVTYSQTDYDFDFGSKPTSLTMAVYQISGALNVRGFGQKVTVAVDGPPSP